MSPLDRTAALERIREDIRKSGFHIYVVSGGASPRFAYTIGLSESLGAELVLAGAIDYVGDEVSAVFHSIRKRLTASRDFDCDISTEELGSFALREAHRSWTQRLLLGAVDYYKSSDVRAYQIVPDPDHWTVDTPNMAREWSAMAEPIWRWLHDEWPYSVPSKSTVVISLEALRGARITKVARRGEGEWEMFAAPGPEASDGEARRVPLGCLLGADRSLAPALDLGVGSGLWRDGDGGDWHPWGGTSTEDSD